ncbi:hypothetical protein EDB92DRAFT_1952867 [Lactarius akahatsu]|uniref:DUF6534 domain-containing protein n=1 Tax=Lactarius akahatsu TaxID=416441 RepID=A0AAD4L8Q5_9AGAM|nr:hypothetical protein EDB92DRAFT_1952867 [Lactarius akahatsu]
MPALIPVDNTLGALFIGTVLSSIIYGVTWLQVYSYYNSHSSDDRWPLKSFVAFLMLVDSANLAFGIYPTYDLVVTNFGNYQAANIFTPWSQAALGLSTVILESSVQHFYAYRIYRLGWRSPYLPIAISVSSLTELGIGTGTPFPSLLFLYLWIAEALSSSFLLIAFSTYMMAASFGDGSFTATLSCKVLCDVLITVGMVYTLLNNRTHVRSTNNVLKLLTIYTINCGILHLVFAITCVILFARYPNALIYTAPFFIMVRLSLCAFILNSRDHLRETLEGPEGAVVVTLTQTSTTIPSGARDTTTEANPNTTAAVPKYLPQVLVSPDTPFADSVVPFDRDKYYPYTRGG